MFWRNEAKCTINKNIFLLSSCGTLYHNGYKFSTKDQDNDANSINCAQLYKGAWWYRSCHHSNLNGLYHGGSHSTDADCVNWVEWRGHFYSLKFTEMKLRKN